MLIGGEAGIGRTRLVEEFAREAADDGSVVLVGGSPALAEADLPFAALVEALRALVRALPPVRLDEVLGTARPQLARLVPSLSGPPVDHAERAGAPDSAQTHLFEGILGVLERLADGPEPAVLALEDLHWADRSTLELLAFLARNLREVSVLVIGTYRSDGVPAGHPLRTLLAELDRSVRVERIELGRFGRDDVRAQLMAVGGGEPDPGLVDEVHRRSDGNPFFAEELAAAIASGEGREVPDTLREVLLTRIAPLPAEVQEVLRMAAIAGRRFDPRLVAAATGLDEPVLIAALRDAVSQHLIVPVRDAEGEGFEFRHGLMREVIYDDIVPGERSRRHALVASAFTAFPDLAGATPGSREAELAHHWLAAGVLDRALPALVRAGTAAEAAYAFPEAARAYGAALAIWDEAGERRARSAGPRARRPIGFRVEEDDPPTEPGPQRLDVMARAAEAEALSGSPGRAVALARTIVAGVGESDPVRLALATERLARYLADDGQGDASLETFAQAAALVADAQPSPESARVLGSYTRALVGAGRYGEARELCERAIVVGEAAGAESEVRRARTTFGVALALQGEVAVGLEQLRAARKRVVDRSASVIRPRPSRIGEVVRGFADLAAILERTGNADEAAAVVKEGSDLARELGVEATWGTTLEIHAALGRFQLGAWEEADRATRRLLSGRVQGAAAAWLHLVRARLETGRGSLDDAALHLEAAQALLPRRADPTLLGELAAAAADLAIWRCQLTEARTIVDDTLTRLHDGEDLLPVARLCWLGIRAEAERSVAARVRRASGELAEAHETAAALRAEAIGVVRGLEPRVQLAPRELRVFPAFGEAEWARVTDVSDPDQWSSAAAHAGEVRDPWLVAYARWREGEAALAAKGGRSRALEPLRGALAGAVALGAEPLRREIEALGRRARLELTPEAEPAPASVRPHDRFGLTARELEVLALVAEGRTNRQIADELFITEKTAGHHVSNLLGKLDAATRVEAAAIAHRLGLLDPVAREPDRD